jgi:hypothetical protein
MRCVDPRCAKQTWTIEDYRIAAKSCLLGRTVAEVVAELACDWLTVNDAVTTYGRALLAADRKRLNQTSAIGLDETSFIKLASKKQADYATTVADVENHQIIDIFFGSLLTRPARTFRSIRNNQSGSADLPSSASPRAAESARSRRRQITL